MKKLVLFFILCFILSGCGVAPVTTPVEGQQQIVTVILQSPNETFAFLQQATGGTVYFGSFITVGEDVKIMTKGQLNPFAAEHHVNTLLETGYKLVSYSQLTGNLSTAIAKFSLRYFTVPIFITPEPLENFFKSEPA